MTSPVILVPFGPAVSIPGAGDVLHLQPPLNVIKKKNPVGGGS